MKRYSDKINDNKILELPKGKKQKKFRVEENQAQLICEMNEQQKLQKQEIDEQDKNSKLSATVTDEGIVKFTASDFVNPVDILKAFTQISHIEKEKLGQEIQAKYTNKGRLQRDTERLTEDEIDNDNDNDNDNDIVHNFSRAASDSSTNSDDDESDVYYSDRAYTSDMNMEDFSESNQAVKLEDKMNDRGIKITNLIENINNIIFDSLLEEEDLKEFLNKCETANNILTEQKKVTEEINKIVDKYSNSNPEQLSEIAKQENKEYQERIDILKKYIPKQKEVYEDLKDVYAKLGGDLSESESEVLAETFFDDNRSIRLDLEMRKRGNNIGILIQEITTIASFSEPKRDLLTKLVNVVPEGQRIQEEQEEVAVKIKEIIDTYRERYNTLQPNEMAEFRKQEDQEKLVILDNYIPEQKKVYEDLKDLYTKLGGDLSKIEGLVDSSSRDVYDDWEMGSEMNELTYENLRDFQIQEAYEVLDTALKQASQLTNRDENLIATAQQLVNDHTKQLEALDNKYGELHDSHAQEPQAFTSEESNFENSRLADYLDYYHKLVACTEQFQKTNPELFEHSEDLYQVGDEAEHIKKVNPFYTGDDTKDAFAVEKALATGYLGYWHKNIADKNKNIPESEKFNAAAQQVIDLNDGQGITPQKLDQLKACNKTFKEIAEKNPEQFLSHLKQALMKARDLYGWADNFQNKWFDLDEGWMRKGMGKLGINRDNFANSYESLLTNGSHKSDKILNTESLQPPPPIDEITQYYQDNLNEIGSTYEGFMRAKAPLEHIQSLLREGVPAPEGIIPKTIRGREVLDVSGERLSCMIRSVLLTAHPEWSGKLREKLADKLKTIVVEKIKNRREKFEAKVAELKITIPEQLMRDNVELKSGFEVHVFEKIRKKEYPPRRNESEDHYTNRIMEIAIQAFAEEKASVALDMPDREELTMNMNDMLNAGGNSGEILFEYMRGKEVKDHITNQKMHLLDPERTFLTYQYLSEKMRIQCIETFPGTSKEPSYAILREDTGADHFRTVLPPGTKISDVNKGNEGDEREEASIESWLKSNFPEGDEREEASINS